MLCVVYFTTTIERQFKNIVLHLYFKLVLNDNYVLKTEVFLKSIAYR